MSISKWIDPISKYVSPSLQGGLAGLAAMFPPTYMNAMLQGQALGGVFAAFTNVFIILLGDEPKDSAFFCFLITITFMVMTGCSLLILTLTKFFRVRCRITYRLMIGKF